MSGVDDEVIEPCRFTDELVLLLTENAEESLAVSMDSTSRESMRRELERDVAMVLDKYLTPREANVIRKRLVKDGAWYHAGTASRADGGAWNINPKEKP